AREADLLLHVLDASHPTWEEQRVVVDQVLAELDLAEKPVLHVFNKVDRLDQGTLVAMQERIGNLLPNSVFASTLAEDGLDSLRRALVTALRARTSVAEVRIGAGDGRLLAELHRGAEVLEQRMEGEEIVLRARLDDALAGRLRRGGARVS
ncbi:MAG TPA: GTPase HflX, partial [Gemmatimonadaceae bacterium]|nr:GTPase HflX [Gemmatimonadaceae bacterium]